MSVFKASFNILKRNLNPFILTLAISIGISFAYSTSSSTPSENVELDKMTIAIFNEDKGSDSQGLTKYLKKTMHVVPLKKQQAAIDDAIFFEKVDYVLTIPKNFSEMIEQNKQPDLTTQTKPNSFNKAYVDSIINTYLTTFQFYREAFPEKSSQEIVQLTTDNVKTKGKIKFDSSFALIKANRSAGKVFSVLAYTMFASIFSLITLINLSFNKPEIKRRNSCSPISNRKFSRQQFLVGFLFSIVVWGVFVSFAKLFSNIRFDQHGIYFILNTFLLLLVALSFSVFISGLISNMDMVSGINNVFILGSAFISGIFVPTEILPDIVTKVAAFTPSYWYAKNCSLIGKTVHFDANFSADFQFNALILLVFALLFFLLAMVTRRDRGGLKISFAKTA
ncbi:ABC transporter permease [Enterococcus rivorum]|nr:ABC transporter permease [Enterococcus rivorum]MBP2097878.1 ABC-2 type transport system permease protein [Enterococcus rivorum]